MEILDNKLCVKEGSTLDVYSVIKDKEAIRKYREANLNSPLFYRFGTVERDNKFFSDECNEKNGYTINMFFAFSKYHSYINREYNLAQCRYLSNTESLDLQEKREMALNHLAFLEDYLQGKFDKEEPKVLYDSTHQFYPDAQMALCAIADPTVTQRYSNNVRFYELARMMQLNEPLYLLQLMLNRNLVSLAGRDMDGLLDLFAFEKENSIRLSDVSDIAKAGLTTDNYDTIIANAEIGKDILTRARSK